MKMRQRHAASWTLADLVDFEVLLTRDGDTVDPAQRRHFVHAIRPQLATIGDAGERRRTGLRLWLEQRRKAERLSTGQLFAQALNLAGWAAFAVLAATGMSLVAGLVLGAQQAVHVVVFVALTLLLPWFVFVLGALVYAFGAGRSGPVAALRIALHLCDRSNRLRAARSTIVAALTDSRS